jgi:hypothetical protein
MRKISWLIVMIIGISLSGCLDTVEETTINENGSGTIVSAADMGKMMGLLKQMGAGNKELKDIDKLKKDTVINLIDIKDSLVTLTDAEKKLFEKANLRVIMDAEEEKFSMTFTIPFDKLSDVAAINALLKKSKTDILSKQMDKVMPGTGGDDEMQMGKGDGGGPDINDYYNFEYKNGKMSKKLNKEKYAKVEEDASLKSLKEMSQMGMPVSFKTIFNLPKQVKKAEGKGVKLSDDKKKITIEGTLDDFFEDASQFEYEIEY